jgi:hypothetical protein
MKCFLVLLCISFCFSRLVINEIDYRQPGSVSTADFVELFNNGPGVEIISGSYLEFGAGNGTVFIYLNITLPSTTISSQSYYVICEVGVINCNLEIPSNGNLFGMAPLFPTTGDSIALRYRNSHS